VIFSVREAVSRPFRYRLTFGRLETDVEEVCLSDICTKIVLLDWSQNQPLYKLSETRRGVTSRDVHRTSKEKVVISQNFEFSID